MDIQRSLSAILHHVEQIDDKMDILLEDRLRNERVVLAEKTLDKFEDYMKNFDKLNSMVNEFKGCVSIARSAVAESKKSRRESLRGLIKFFNLHMDN